MRRAHQVCAVADALDCVFTTSHLTDRGFEVGHFGAPGYHVVLEGGPLTWRDHRVIGSGSWGAGTGVEAAVAGGGALSTDMSGDVSADAGAGTWDLRVAGCSRIDAETRTTWESSTALTADAGAAGASPWAVLDLAAHDHPAVRTRFATLEDAEVQEHLAFASWADGIWGVSGHAAAGAGHAEHFHGRAPRRRGERHGA